MDKDNRLSFLVPIILSAALYVFIAYNVDRHETAWLFPAYGLLFIGYLWLVKQVKNHHVTFILLVSIFFRLLLLLAFPNLSDDIYRFVWDGRLLLNGINPFDNVPTYLVQSLPEGLSTNLYHQLNSPDYFTIYPPFAQFVFLLSARGSPDSLLGSAVIMRLLIILAEVGSMYYLLKLLDFYGVPRKNAAWYAINPLVIIELTGNLHFEAFMIVFVLAALFYLVKNKLFTSALFMALAVAVKLIPLLLLPLFLRRMSRKKLFIYYAYIGCFILLFFLPLLGKPLIDGMGSSLSLYFQKFEFNGSIYYMVREFGYLVKGFNIIGTAGPWLALVTFVLIIAFALYFRKMKLPQAFVWVLMIYLLFATTVHPWYIVPVLVFSIFTNYRFVVLWTFLIFLTYAGYTTTGYNEYLWITIVEYLLLFTYMFYELFKSRNTVRLSLSRD